MGSVLQKFDADASAVEKELAKMRREYDKLLSKIDEIGKQSEKSSKKQDSAWERNSKNITASIGKYVALGSVVASLNREQERQLQLQDKLLQKNISIAQSQAAVRKNIGDVSTADFQKFLTGIQGVQKQTGFGDLSQLNRASADVLSATGSNQKQTIEVLRATAPIFRDNPEELAQFAGGVADLMSASGSTAEQATALALAGFGNSRTTSLTAFKNVAQSIKSGQSFLQGVDGKQRAEEITGLFGTLSRFSGDSEGSTTRTASIKFLQKLEEFGGTGSTLDRLSRVQKGIASGDIKTDDILKGFEAQSLGAVRDILTNSGSEASKDLVKTIGATKGSANAYRRLVSDLTGGTDQLALMSSENQRAAAADEYATSDAGLVSAQRSEIRQIYKDAVSKVTKNNLAQLGIAAAASIRDEGSFLTPATQSTFDTPGLAKELASELESRAYFASPGQDGARDAQVLREAAQQLKEAAQSIERGEKVRQQSNRQSPIAQAAVHDERG